MPLDKTDYSYVQRGAELLPGSAVGRRIRIRLEEHPTRHPILGTLTGYVKDRDFPEYGWYIVQLDEPVAIYREADSQILIFGTSEGLAGPPRGPVYDSEGKGVLYYYKTPIEEMFLNPDTEVKDVFVMVGVLLDLTTQLNGYVSRSQLYIHRYAFADDPESLRRSPES